MALIISNIVASAQETDVTKFLGIPIDGFKPQMISKLKQKGFVQSSNPDVLTGEFNGRDVEVSVVTNNNKVYRIFLEDAYYCSEADIKIRFNNLCRQFDKNQKYIRANSLTSEDGYTIPDKDDISYEMSVHNKRYEASYWQAPENVDTLAIQQQMMDRVMAKYSKEELDNASEETKTQILTEALSYFYEIMSKKSVWFMINERGGRYGILMYYDNGYNQADGEDL